jgi:gas vesicle protein
VSERGSGLGAFLFGVAVGALFGVLFAPERGDRTRRKLGRTLGTLKERAREEMDELVDAVAGEAAPEVEEVEPPSSREELAERLAHARRRRRLARAGRGRAVPPGEDDEPVA